MTLIHKLKVYQAAKGVVLCPIQQSGLHWDRPTAFVTCGPEIHIELTSCN